MCIPTIVSDSIPTGERRLPDFNELEEAVGQIYPSQQTPSPFSAVVRTDTMVSKAILVGSSQNSTNAI